MLLEQEQMELEVEKMKINESEMLNKLSQAEAVLGEKLSNEAKVNASS